MGSGWCVVLLCLGFGLLAQSDGADDRKLVARFRSLFGRMHYEVFATTPPPSEPTEFPEEEVHYTPPPAPPSPSNNTTLPLASTQPPETSEGPVTIYPLSPLATARPGPSNNTTDTAPTSLPRPTTRLVTKLPLYPNIGNPGAYNNTTEAVPTSLPRPTTRLVTKLPLHPNTGNPGSSNNTTDAAPTTLPLPTTTRLVTKLPLHPNTGNPGSSNNTTEAVTTSLPRPTTRLVTKLPLYPNTGNPGASNNTTEAVPTIFPRPTTRLVTKLPLYPNIGNPGSSNNTTEAVPTSLPRPTTSLVTKLPLHPNTGNPGSSNNTTDATPTTLPPPTTFRLVTTLPLHPNTGNPGSSNNTTSAERPSLPPIITRLSTKLPLHPTTGNPSITRRPWIPQSGCFCNFDYSMCNFFQSTKDTFDWCHGRGVTSAPGNGPTTDHTTGQGSYMYMKSELPHRPGDDASLYLLEALSGTTCLSFYYHMHGDGIGSLAVSVDGKAVFVRTGNQGNMWRKGKVNITNKGSTMIEFIGTVGSVSSREIALDDVSLRQCYIPATVVPSSATNNTTIPLPPSTVLPATATVLPSSIVPGPTNTTTIPLPPSTVLPTTVTPMTIEQLQCDFEYSMCGWAHYLSVGEGTFYWQLRQGPAPTEGTGPLGDHTTGKGFYLYADTKPPRVDFDRAVIHSPRPLRFQGPVCMTFFYQMSGSDMNELQVWERTSFTTALVFARSPDDRVSSSWKMARQQLTKDCIEISIEAFIMNAGAGCFAIDDILFQRGLCSSVATPSPKPQRTTAPQTPPPTPPPLPNCNFDQGKPCPGWQQRKDDDFDWTIRRGSTPSSDGKGYYAFLDSGSGYVGDKAILETRHPVSGPVCMTFLYYVYRRDSGDILDVYDDNGPLFSESKRQGKSWTRESVQIKGKTKVYIKGTVGTYIGSVAIDDITFKKGECQVIKPTPGPHCGFQGTRARIVGGDKAEPGQWPWQAMLRYKPGGQFCGGTLLNSRWVLTAAHCLTPVTAKTLHIRLGAHKRNNNLHGRFQQNFNVDKIIIHPNYNSHTASSDIGLVKLSKTARMTKYVRTACLGENGMYPLPVDDPKKCWVTGWGTLWHEGPASSTLMQVAVPVKSKADCYARYPDDVDETMLCAGLEEGGVDSCQGDSGGPLVCNNQGRWFLEGVVSWGYNCAKKGQYGIYSNVRYFNSWIRKTIANN